MFCDSIHYVYVCRQPQKPAVLAQVNDRIKLQRLQGAGFLPDTGISELRILPRSSQLKQVYETVLYVRHALSDHARGLLVFQTFPGNPPSQRIAEETDYAVGDEQEKANEDGKSERRPQPEVMLEYGGQDKIGNNQGQRKKRAPNEYIEIVFPLKRADLLMNFVHSFTHATQVCRTGL